MLSKVLFVGKKTWRLFGHCVRKLQWLTRVNELKIIFFVLNYFTVLVHTETLIHFSVRG